MATMASPEGLEVRCVGCGETLDVDPGLTEFICPDCATPQSLPPELMPPPPPRRKALPLPRAAADVRGARLPCGSCGALLSVPVGLARCACPVCGAELAIDTARLRHYLLSSAMAEGSISVVPVGDYSAPPILQAREVRQEHPNFGISVGLHQTESDDRPNCMEQVQAKRPNQLIPEQADIDNPQFTSEGEEVYDVNGIAIRHTKQTNIHSVGPGIVSAEKRHEEPPNHVRHQAQVQCSTAHINTEKGWPLTPNQTAQQAHKQPSGRVTENARAEDGDGAIHVQEKQQQHVNQEKHTEELCTQVANDIIAGDSNRRGVRCTARLVATGAEKMKMHEANEAIKQVQLQPSDSAIHMESEYQVICVENEQSKSSSCRILERKKKGLAAASNSGLQLRRSKRLAKDSSASIDINNICPSSSPRHEVPETSYKELHSRHLTAQLCNSHLDLSDPEQFARNYIPPEVKKALAYLGSNSLLKHKMSQASSGEECLHDLADSEGGDPWISTCQNVGTKRKHRHPRNLTLGLKMWTLPKGVRIPISLNTSGEPVGEEAGTLSSFLCALARDGVLAPLIYQDWRRVPEKNKDIMWRIVKLKFDIAPIGELWVIKSLGKRWRSWKSILKVKHYDTHETEEERLADQNPRVLEEQWRFLVAYWNTEKATAASARNKACQANAVAHHTAGTKSFARIIEEEKQKRPNKDGLSAKALFILTHTPKNGKPIKKATADIIARLREDSQKRAEGSGSDSTSHNSVLEFSSKGPRGKAALRLQASFKEAMEAKQRAEDEADALKKKMMVMEENQRKMQEDLANMKSAVSAINKTTPTGTNFRDELTDGPSFPPGFAQEPNPPPPRSGSKRSRRR